MNAQQDVVPTETAPEAAMQGATGAAPDVAELDFSNRLSDAQANTIYTSAYHLANKGEYNQASALFGLLGMYRPYEPKYAHAVAVCFRKMGRYEDAIPLFARTMELSPDDYGPAFELIECLMLLERREQALDLLTIIAGVAREENRSETLERALALTELIQSGTK